MLQYLLGVFSGCPGERCTLINISSSPIVSWVTIEEPSRWSGTELAAIPRFPDATGRLPTVSIRRACNQRATAVGISFQLRIATLFPSENRIDDGGLVPVGGLNSDNGTHPSPLVGSAAGASGAGLGAAVSCGSADAVLLAEIGSLANIGRPEARLGRHSSSNCRAHWCAGVSTMDNCSTRRSSSGF